MEHREIILRFGGVTKMSEALGMENRTTVQYWEQKGVIPKWRHHEILQAARKLRLGLKETDLQNGASK
jgi:hypothetical protein